MTDDPLRAAMDLIAEESSYKTPKDPKGSARQKYNRRKLHVAHALSQMEIAIADLLAQDGSVYKRDEIDTLSQAIADFRQRTGWRSPEAYEPTQEEREGFMDMLESLRPWEPPPEQELAELFASVGLSFHKGDAPDEDV